MPQQRRVLNSHTLKPRRKRLRGCRRVDAEKSRQLRRNLYVSKLGRTRRDRGTKSQTPRRPGVEPLKLKHQSNQVLTLCTFGEIVQRTRSRVIDLQHTSLALSSDPKVRQATRSLDLATNAAFTRAKDCAAPPVDRQRVSVIRQHLTAKLFATTKIKDHLTTSVQRHRWCKPQTQVARRPTTHAQREHAALRFADQATNNKPCQFCPFVRYTSAHACTHADANLHRHRSAKS